MSEHDEQAAFFQIAGYMLAQYPMLRWLHAIPNGGARNVVVAKKLKDEGVVRGIADVCLPYPSGGYHGLYIEFKYGKNKLTSEQREFLEYAANHGYQTGVAYSADDGIEMLKAYLEGEAPVKILVEKFDTHPSVQDLPTLSDLKGINFDTGGLDSVDFVRKIRDEW